MKTLPNGVIDIIYSFFNPHKSSYDRVLLEFKQKIYYKGLMRQLSQYATYNKNGNVIAFQKYSILNRNY
jgi:hypothetical protein